MANKTKKTMTIEVKVNVGNCLWAIAWLAFLLLA